MKFYDSDLASDNPADFYSDHEPPKDKIHDKKQLRKEELRRIHKQIISVILLFHLYKLTFSTKISDWWTHKQTCKI